MKQTASRQKTASSSARSSNSIAPGPNGIAIKPPAYGVASTDGQVLQRQSEDEERTAPPHRTGLPERLKAGLEQLSGIALDDVRVQYNSSRPEQLNALAYTQGSEIHVAPGQERHLPHEAWHAVQQKQGRVRPTTQLKGNAINDNRGLEREADVMGARGLRERFWSNAHAPQARSGGNGTLQLKSQIAIQNELAGGGLMANIGGMFASKHVGLGMNTNASAALVHAQRPNPPQTNTVIQDPRALKDSLRAGAWQQRGNNRWRVTSQGNIALQSTRRSVNPIAAPPAGPALLGANAADPDNFAISSGGTVTAVTGVTAGELATATATVGAYPTRGRGANLRRQRRDYRSGIVADVNAQRSQAYETALVQWIHGNFNRIGTTNLTQAHGTLAAINAIPYLQQQVTVEFNDQGEIDHFEGYQ